MIKRLRQFDAEHGPLKVPKFRREQWVPDTRFRWLLLALDVVLVAALVVFLFTSDGSRGAIGLVVFGLLSYGLGRLYIVAGPRRGQP